MRTLLIVLSALVLGGCAYGRTASYSDASLQIAGPQVSSVALAVAVQDRRPYVLSGSKPEKFVGLHRGGFGNPFDVNTSSGGPLSLELRDSVAKALKAKGFQVTPVVVEMRDSSEAARRKLSEARSRRAALITLTEWKSDSMINSEIQYDLVLTVLDERGNVLATNASKGTDNIGSQGLSPEEGIQKAFARKLEGLFDDPRVIAALRS